MREGPSRELKACGSGLLSSYGELEHALESPQVERLPLQLDRVIHTPFDIDRYQPLLMVMDSFEQLYDMIERLEKWMRAGRLDHVAPGEPEVHEDDLRSFLEAGARRRSRMAADHRATGPGRYRGNDLLSWHLAEA
jgi:phenylalanine-4-hydroxylase